ncbi:hypothetical protein KP509_38G052400 [Ceratopteris richardii]|nr:hypothetical protein KP509_38G052400 [Ceratopteris richardii]
MAKEEDKFKGSSSALPVSPSASLQSPPFASGSVTPKKVKDSYKPRIGFMDILMGYHSLLQATPILYPAGLQRRQTQPTVGFLNNLDYRNQR